MTAICVWRQQLLGWATPLLACACIAAAPPATQRNGMRHVAADYAHLNDPHSAVRQEARMRLMQLPSSDLDELLAVVRHTPPSASQVSPLREVVNELYVRDKLPHAQGGRGFLGITLGVIGMEAKNSTTAQMVMVESRMAGFVGYRALEDGDIILAVTDKQTVRIDDVTTLQQAIVSHPAGTQVTLSVLRGGRIVEVSLKLDGMPSSLSRQDAGNMPVEPEQFQVMQNQRVEQATQYWNQNFAPLCR